MRNGFLGGGGVAFTEANSSVSEGSLIADWAM
jgi:hypothetical protein